METEEGMRQTDLLTEWVADEQAHTEKQSHMNIQICSVHIRPISLRENRKAEQGERGCEWLSLVQFNPSDRHAAAQQISAMMLWLNSVPSPKMLHKTRKERSMLTTCVSTMLKACWEIAIQILTFVLKSSFTSVMYLGAQNARKHTDPHTTGRSGAYCCDCRGTHSSTRCVCDRPGLGRWRWGKRWHWGERTESRETHSTAHYVSSAGYRHSPALQIQNPAFRGDSIAN